VEKDQTRILDIGAGTGIWAIEMAEKYPKVEVIGTDLCLIQPQQWVPPNCRFEVDDAEQEWIYDKVYTAADADTLSFFFLVGMGPELMVAASERRIYSRLFICGMYLSPTGRRC